MAPSVAVKKAARTAARTCAQPNGVLHQSALDLRVKGGHALIVERHLPAYKHVQDDTETPHIDLGPGVHLRVEELWRGKVEGATERRKVIEGVV